MNQDSIRCACFSIAPDVCYVPKEMPREWKVTLCERRCTSLRDQNKVFFISSLKQVGHVFRAHDRVKVISIPNRQTQGRGTHRDGREWPG
jgi:hypothetical protein